MAILGKFRNLGGGCRCGWIRPTLAVWLLLLAGAADFFSPAAAAQELTAPEYQVKAVFLYNFAKLTEWPTNAFPGTNTTFTIGVVGKDPFGTNLETVIRGKTVTGRAIVIARFATVNEIEACQLLFIPRSENGRLPATLAALADRPVLTVGDAPDFTRHGGIIGLVKARDEIHFEINRVAAAQAGLKLSSKLLRLAEIVQPDPERKSN